MERNIESGEGRAMNEDSEVLLAVAIKQQRSHGNSLFSR
jgi:hypothetical protein